MSTAVVVPPTFNEAGNIRRLISAAGLGSAWCKLLSRAAAADVRQVTRIGVADITGGLRAFRSSLLADIDWDAIGVSGCGFQGVSLRSYVDSGARIAEAPIRFRPRAEGPSKMSFGIMLEGLRIGSACRPRPVAPLAVGFASGR